MLQLDHFAGSMLYGSPFPPRPDPYLPYWGFEDTRYLLMAGKIPGPTSRVSPEVLQVKSVTSTCRKASEAVTFTSMLYTESNEGLNHIPQERTHDVDGAPGRKIAVRPL